MQFVEFFSEPSQLNVILHERKQPRSAPRESLAFLLKLFSVVRPELRSGYRVNKASRSKLIGAQHLFHKNPDRPRKRIQGIGILRKRMVKFHMLQYVRRPQ